MKPLGQLLDRHELIRAVVELMPDGVEGLRALGLDTGIGGALGVPRQLGSGLGHVGTRPHADPVPTRGKRLPVGAGDNDLVGVGHDHLFGVQLAKGGGNNAFGDVVAAGHLHEQAEVFIAKTQAAVIGVATDPLDKHGRARRLLRGNHVGHAADLLVAKRNEILGPLLFAEQLAEQAHGRLGVGHRLVAKVHVHHRDAQGIELLDIARILGGMLRLDIEDDHVGALRDGLLDIEGAVFKTAEGGDLGDGGKLAQVSVIGVWVGLDQVLAPANDPFNRVLRVQRRHQVQLAALAKNHPLHRQLDLDLAPKQIGDGGQRRHARQASPQQPGEQQRR